MKTLYIDCAMGAAGDMLTAALLELLPDPDGFVEQLNGLGIPGVVYRLEPSVKCGIKGSHMTVTVNGEEEQAFFDALRAAHHHDHHDHHDGHDNDHHHDHDHHDHDHYHDHPHSGLHEIEHILEDLPVPAAVKEDILAVYRLIAEAESHVHGEPVEQIHFHEVGAMDAVADVTAVCLLMAAIGAEQVLASTVNVGGGTVKCAHGVLPAPAPATEYLLRGVPAFSGAVKSELCTPTGAALLKHFVTRFCDRPVLTAQAVGYGMGTKDFEVANCLRATLGETEQKPGTVTELRCNLDDMTAEDLSFAMERLFALGAREAFTVPVGMKKNRAGLLLVVVCDNEDRDKMVRAIFRYTTTLGVREYVTPRYTLRREICSVETPFGTVRKKTASGYGATRCKYEYDDLARIAREKDLTLDEVRKLVKDAESDAE